MKMNIIRTAIGLTALVASFLPQQAQADSCEVSCGGFLGFKAKKCKAESDTKAVKCYCDDDNKPVCQTG